MEHLQTPGLSPEEKKAAFKEATITHRLLEQTDRAIMRAIREHGGFAYVLLYGPSGVGKTTMIRQISKRLNGTIPLGRASHLSAPLSGDVLPVPLLVLETRPPDGAAFNRSDYYRNALIKLGEPFYEHKRLIDIHSDYAGERRTHHRGKAAHFNESPALRNAMEAAMQRRGVRAVILDEAQHLLTIGQGAAGRSLLDQLDWIKSMTNVTDIVHILVGTYELLSFTRLNGQASRRGLPIHFPRYQLQRQEDCTEFQAALLALLKKVPLQTDTETLVIKHWLYFYERCIGCIGVLADWLLRAVSATLDEGGDTLTLERVQEHALSIAQCEQMALDAVEGEQKLNYTEGRREHLWRLLQGEGIFAAIPSFPIGDAETTQTRLETALHAEGQQETSSVTSSVDTRPKRTMQRVGQQAPRRERVGRHPGAEEKPKKCPFSGVVDLSPAQLEEAGLAKLECPECGAVWSARIRGETVVFPPHPPRTTKATRAKERWVRRGSVWERSDEKG